MARLMTLVSIGLMVVVSACGDGSDPADAGPDDTYPYPAGKVFFTHLPIGVHEDVFFWESMGALITPYHQDHGAFFHTQLDNLETTIPVIAPADGQIIEIRTHVSHNRPFEHALRMQISTTIQLLWGHVGELPEDLAAEAGPLGTSRDVTIPVRAGDTLGYVANVPLDLAVNDSTYEAGILHSEFQGPNPYSAPLEDYYQEPLKSQLLEWTARELEPRTGVMGHDVPGTLLGFWYMEGSDPAAEFRHDHGFTFGYHHLQAHRTTVSDGLVFSQHATGNTMPSVFWIKGNPRMEDITPASGQVKLEMYPSVWGVDWDPPSVTLSDISGLDDGVPTSTILLVEMVDEDTMRLERFDAPGISPDDVTGFTSNARTYHRNPLSG